MPNHQTAAVFFVQNMRVDLSKRYVEDLAVMSRATDVHAADQLLLAASDLRNRLRIEIELNPEMAAEDVTRDLRYKLGAVAALNAVLDIPATAGEIIERMKAKQ